MKFKSPKLPLGLILLLLVGCWLLHASADEETCPSVWVYKPFKSCVTYKNGLDISRPQTSISVGVWSPWMKGGNDQAEVCRNVLSSYNSENEPNGLLANLIQPMPVDEEQKDMGLREIQYHYLCSLSVAKYSFKKMPNAVCGVEDEWAYQVSGSDVDIPGKASCLSCDPLDTAPPEAMVTCLKNSLLNIVQPRAIPVRDTDLQLIAAQVKKIIEINSIAPISNLKGTNDLALFAGFLKATENLP